MFPKQGSKKSSGEVFQRAGIFPGPRAGVPPAPKLLSPTPALAQPVSPVWSTKGVGPASHPMGSVEYSVIERSQINQAGLGSLLKSQKVQFLMVSSQLEYPHKKRLGVGGKEGPAGPQMFLSSHSKLRDSWNKDAP